MVDKGWIGEKQGQGFYKKVKSADGKEIQALNLETMDYSASRKISSALLEAAKQAKGTVGKLKPCWVLKIAIRSWRGTF